MKGPSHEARAADVWDVLTARAGHEGIITYGELGRRIQVHHRALRYALEPVQAYCLEEGLPPLTILVQSVGGELGAGFTAWERGRVQEGVEKVREYQWEGLDNPFELWRSGETIKGLVQEVIASPEGAKEVFARVRVRGMQQRVFREVLMTIYEGACAVSGSTMTVGLDACHIVPWVEASGGEAFHPQNGLLMQAWYHRLFDAGLLDVDEQYYLRVRDDAMRAGSVADEEMLRKIDGQRLRLPARKTLWPSQELLRRRRASGRGAEFV